ncbi:transcription factor AP-2 domain-containing protein [Ditylenchus destructor]|uniref:Transcription factor AP-2 domain-containing protein n=1 Tax=Ditylenchus destructor TaxID=166010 RepID=A0AAD4QUA9_9BILA|nr:transcription factor AP-2 domain-containing protein [Ditylenchus destructor]
MVNNRPSRPLYPPCPDSKAPNTTKIIKIPSLSLFGVDDELVFCLSPSLSCFSILRTFRIQTSLIRGSGILLITQEPSSDDSMISDNHGGVIRKAEYGDSGYRLAGASAQTSNRPLRMSPIRTSAAELSTLIHQQGNLLPGPMLVNPLDVFCSVPVEALHLAKDFSTLCETEFPEKQISEYLTRTKCNGMSQAEIQRRRNMILAVRTILSELKDLLNQDRSPLCASTPRPILAHSIQKHLTHFSLVTHGFGTPAVQSGLTAVTNWLSESN